MLWITFFIIYAVHIQIAYSREYLLRLKSNAPAMKGSVVTFKADLLEMNGSPVATADYKWEWLIDDHEKQEFRTNSSHAEWTYRFPRHSNKNLNKTYKMNVNVGQWYVFFAYPMASNSIEINVTATLNGEIKLRQNDKHLMHTNISSNVALEQKLSIRPEDFESIENATNTMVHWFIDCQYVRQTKDFETQHIFNESNKTHHIEALIEASFESTPSKSVPTLKSKLISNWRQQHKADLPFICQNQSHTTPDPNKIYGYFQTNVTVFDPISDVIVNGTTWINDGDDYELNIFCSGSSKFEYCLRQIDGPYIMEGNETCNVWTIIDECHQNLKFSQNVLNVDSFTVLVIIRNAVSIERKLFVVNIKQPIIFIATVAGIVVFIVCLLGVITCCLVRCIRKRRRMSKKSIRTDAEASLIGHHPDKASDIQIKPAKPNPNKLLC